MNGGVGGGTCEGSAHPICFYKNIYVLLLLVFKMNSYNKNRIFKIYKKRGTLALIKSIVLNVIIPFITQFFSYFRKIIYKIRWGRAAPEAYNIIYINPQDVEYVLIPHFKPLISWDGTYIRKGDWDKNKKTPQNIFDPSRETLNDNIFLLQIEKYWLFDSMKKHLVNGISWEDTILYERYHHNYDFETANKELKNKVRKIQRLYWAIKNNGFLTQRHLKDNKGHLNSSPVRPPEWDEIMVVIGRDGEIFLETCGRHRLFIAKILGIPKIPVRVLARHKKWQEKRFKISNTPKEELSSKYKKLLSHPDMQDIIDQ